MQSLRQAGKDVICSSGNKGPLFHSMVTSDPSDHTGARNRAVAVRSWSTLSAARTWTVTAGYRAGEKRLNASGDGGDALPHRGINCTAQTSEPTCLRARVFSFTERDRCEAPRTALLVVPLTGGSFDSLTLCNRACTQTAACIGIRNLFIFYCVPLRVVQLRRSPQLLNKRRLQPGQCPSGYTWDGSYCAGAVQCAQGTYVSQEKRCVDQATVRVPLWVGLFRA